MKIEVGLLVMKMFPYMIQLLLAPESNFFSVPCSFRENMPNKRLAPCLGLVPPTQNLGSATAFLRTIYLSFNRLVFGFIEAVDRGKPFLRKNHKTSL